MRFFSMKSQGHDRGIDMRVLGSRIGEKHLLHQRQSLWPLELEVSCDQSIAGNGVFSLAMLAEFEPVLRRRGAAFYRQLHWEAGVIGQVLYLESEAAGLRGTGMGCFLDNPTHRAFGIRDRMYQTLYHFTTGGGVEDERLTTLPAYS